jgi:hypothetical protein
MVDYGDITASQAAGKSGSSHNQTTKSILWKVYNKAIAIGGANVGGS